MSKRKKNVISECITIGLLLVLYIVVGKIFGVGCPIKFFTGVSCAGCGMTRAWGALLQMNMEQALYYHPLFWIPIVCVIAFVWKDSISVKKYKALWCIVLVVSMCVYVYRLMDTSDTVVVFEPHKSKLVEMGMWFLNIINSKKEG